MVCRPTFLQFEYMYLLLCLFKPKKKKTAQKGIFQFPSGPMRSCVYIISFVNVFLWNIISHKHSRLWEQNNANIKAPCTYIMMCYVVDIHVNEFIPQTHMWYYFPIVCTHYRSTLHRRIDCKVSKNNNYINNNESEIENRLTCSWDTLKVYVEAVALLPGRIRQTRPCDTVWSRATRNYIICTRTPIWTVKIWWPEPFVACKSHNPIGHRSSYL